MSKIKSPKWRKFTWFLLPLVILIPCGFAWQYVSSKPVYQHLHEQNDDHTHHHVHDGVISHDHTHYGLLGRTSHSHPHVHQHVHDRLDDLEISDRLTEIGHVHHEDGEQAYWISTNLNGKKLSVEFWTHEDSKLFKTSCDQDELSATVVVAGGKEFQITLTRDSDEYSSLLPEVLPKLPNNLLGIAAVSIDKNDFKTVRVAISIDD